MTSTSEASGSVEPTSPSPSGVIDACSLLTVDEVSQAVGATVGPGQGSRSPVATGGTQSTCEWPEAANPADTAKVSIYSQSSAADSVRTVDSKPVSGIGDQAFVGDFASVWVYTGSQAFLAQWYTFDGTDAENLPKSKALALVTAGKL